MRPWQPVLDGPDVERAWRVIDHVAAALRDPPPPYDGQIDDDLLRAGLFAREAGFAVFYSYLARARGDDAELRVLASGYLGEAVDRIQAIAVDRPQFSYGFAGTAWAFAHLCDYLDQHDDDDPLRSIDDALAELVAAKAADAPFMLNTGFVGYGAYALERMPTARRCLERVCERLVAAAEPAGEGVCWRIRGAWMVSAGGEPDDQHHTGIRSGATGAIAILGAAARWGIAVDPAVAARGVAWLWSLRGDQLPAIAGGSDRMLGYAHGAAAAAAALVAAGLDDERARAIGLVAALRPSGRVDAISLEGGAAGEAHAFMRLFHATGDPRFREAARGWLGVVLDAYDPAIALGGYHFHVPDWERRYDAAIPTGARELPGISFGVAGIALALLAAITSIEPAWDRMFLLSARDPGSAGDRIGPLSARDPERAR